MSRFPFFSILEQWTSVCGAELSMYGVFCDTLCYLYRYLPKWRLQNFEALYLWMKELLRQKKRNLWSIFKMSRFPFFWILEQKVSGCGDGWPMYSVCSNVSYYLYRYLPKWRLQNFKLSYLGVRALLGLKDRKSWSLFEMSRFPFFQFWNRK